MSTLEEIKSKYGLSNDGAVTISVDVEALREIANSLLEDSKSVEKDMANAMERDYATRRKQRVAANIKEQKRNVEMAQKFLDEINATLDKANETLAKAK
ncbi:MAG: hypothetical protein IKT43_03655 [Clostridia bacterium]|nr:hypothetical protein [Clostridia bacterium]